TGCVCGVQEVRMSRMSKYDEQDEKKFIFLTLLIPFIPLILLIYLFLPRNPIATTYISEESARLALGLTCLTEVKFFFMRSSRSRSVPPCQIFPINTPSRFST